MENTTTSFSSYSTIFTIGHKALEGFFDEPVQVEEKIDGSQFSFCLTPEGELRLRSKGAIIYEEAPPKMFNNAITTVQAIKDKLTPGWTYRAEYLSKPKHNTLAYDRIPQGHLIVFDINPEKEAFMSWEDKQKEATRLGLECVPLLYTGIIKDVAEFRTFLDTTSVLGGQKIEGVVCKRIAGTELYGPDKKALMAKFVSEAFKEAHSGEWTKANPTQGDILQEIATRYCTQARWMKAVQHLQEAGLITNTPKDIGSIIKEVPEDVLKECKEEMLNDLWKWAWPHVKRNLIRGLPEWYKEELLKVQFETTTTNAK